MDLLSKDVPDDEPFFHLSASSAPLSTSINPRRGGDRTGFDFRGHDRSDLASLRSNTPWLDEGPISRRHRSSSTSGFGSTAYLTKEGSSSKKELDMDSYNSAIVSAVERTMKNYADSILRVLEGMSGRLSQLESITQDLEHSVGSLKVSVDEYYGEADGRLRMLNNRMMEMHRAVQILRDKQDIVETHAELARLQSSKSEALVENSNARGSVAKETIDSAQTSKQNQNQQLSAHVASNSGQAMYSTQLQVLSPQQDSIASNESVVQLQPSPSSPSFKPPQQYFPAQLLQQQQAQQLHVQTQSAGQQPLQPQLQIQHSLPQPLQAQTQHMQTQMTMQQQAQGLQSLPPQGSQQALPPQTQHLQTQIIMQKQAQGLPAQGPMQQQPLPPQEIQAHTQHMHTQMSIQQQAQGPQALPQRHQLQEQSQLQLLPQQTPNTMKPQLDRAQFQGVPQQMQVQQSLQQQTPGQQQALITAQQALPAQTPMQPPRVQQQQGPFQQYDHQNERQTYSPNPPGAFLQAPFAQGGYTAESSYGHANLGFSQQQLSSVPQRPSQLLPQNYSSHQRINLSAAPPSATQLPYEPSAGNYSGPLSWHGQNPLANSRLPAAQPIHGEPVPGGNLRNNHSPLDKVIEEVVAMGFSRGEVQTVIKRFTEKGQSVDMNVVLDTLMNGARESQPQTGWQGR